MSTEKNKQIFLIAILSVVVNFLVALSGSFSQNGKLFFGVVVYFFLSKYLLTNKLILSKEISFWLFITPIFIFQLSSNLFQYESTINSLPIHILFLLSAFTGYAYVKFSRISIILFLVLLFWFNFYGKKLYLDYRFFNISKEINIKPDLFKGLKTKYNSDFTTNNDKLSIIDFWNSKCAPCYKQFPYIDSVSKLIDTSKVVIFLLNIPINGETKEKNYSILNKYDYSFNQLFANDGRIMDSLKIYYFPTTIVIKNGVILFSGEFKDAIKKFRR